MESIEWFGVKEVMIYEMTDWWNSTSTSHGVCGILW